MAAMQPDSLDILEKAKLPPEQARAFVSAMKIEIGRATETLATKHDIELVHREMAEMRQALEFKIDGLDTRFEGKLEGVRSNMESKVTGVRSDLESKIEGLRSSLEAKIEGLRSSLESKIEGLCTSLEAKTEELRGNLETKIERLRGDLRDEIHATAISGARHLYGAILAQMAVLLGIVYALTHTGY